MSTAKILTVVTEALEEVESCVAAALGVAPDLTPETLPLLDAFLRTVVAGKDAEERRLLLAAVGGYFGEVARRHLDGRWVVESADAGSWRVELNGCFLYFWPVGMAAEVLQGGETEEYDGSFATLDELHDGLAEVLANAAPVSHDDYYSLAGRIDVLELAVEWLTRKRLWLADGARPTPYTAEDYARAIGERE